MYGENLLTERTKVPASESRYERVQVRRQVQVSQGIARGGLEGGAHYQSLKSGKHLE